MGKHLASPGARGAVLMPRTNCFARVSAPGAVLSKECFNQRGSFWLHGWSLRQARAHVAWAVSHGTKGGVSRAMGNQGHSGFQTMAAGLFPGPPGWQRHRSDASRGQKSPTPHPEIREKYSVSTGERTEKPLASDNITCNAAAVGHAHGADAVVGDGRNFTGTACPVVVSVLLIWVGHGVGVIGVQVIAAFRALRTHPPPLVRGFLRGKQDLILRASGTQRQGPRDLVPEHPYLSLQKRCSQSQRWAPLHVGGSNSKMFWHPAMPPHPPSCPSQLAELPAPPGLSRHRPFCPCQFPFVT